MRTRTVCSSISKHLELAPRISSLGIPSTVSAIRREFATVDAFRTPATPTASETFWPNEKPHPPPPLSPYYDLARSTITTAASPICILRSILRRRTDVASCCSPIYPCPPPPPHPQFIVAMSATAVLSRASFRGVAACLRSSSSGIRSAGIPRVYVFFSLALRLSFQGLQGWGICGGVSTVICARIHSDHRYRQLSWPLLTD